MDTVNFGITGVQHIQVGQKASLLTDDKGIFSGIDVAGIDADIIRFLSGNEGAMALNPKQKAAVDQYFHRTVNGLVVDLKLFGQPLFIRFGHEMNDPYRYSWGPQNNTPEDFIAAWKHMVDYFKAEGVDNVIWVWSPHIAYGLFEEYYPGDDYVDWVGVGTDRKSVV